MKPPDLHFTVLWASSIEPAKAEMYQAPSWHHPDRPLALPILAINGSGLRNGLSLRFRLSLQRPFGFEASALPSFLPFSLLPIRQCGQSNAVACKLEEHWQKVSVSDEIPPQASLGLISAFPEVKYVSLTAIVLSVNSH